MKKKILFLNTSKLATLSAVLLLAVFCTIGMSFTPEDGEGVTTPQDSVYVTGPRRSHWTTSQTTGSGCNATTTYTYHHKNDYGKVIAHSLGGGSVSVSGNHTTSASTNSSATTAGTTSYVTWNSNMSTKENTDASSGTEPTEAALKVAHTNEVTFTATPAEGYYFVGWYGEEGCTTQKSDKDHPEYSEEFTIPNYSYSGGSENTQYQSSGSPWTQHRYAKFAVIPGINITFLAPSTPSVNRGTYTVTSQNTTTTISTSNQTIEVKGTVLEASLGEAYEFVDWYKRDGSGNETIISTENPSEQLSFLESVSVGVHWKELHNNMNMTFKAVELDGDDNPVGSYIVNSTTVQASDYVYNTGSAYRFSPTLKATPATGYIFTGWYIKNGKKKEYLSTESTWTPTFTEEITLYAGFAFVGYTDDQKAQFKVGSNYYTDLNAANTAAGSNGTIVCTRDGILPPGDYTISKGVKLYIPYSTSDSYQTTPAVVTTAETLSAYRTLTFADGANVTVADGGIICVGGKIMSAGGGNKSAYVTGPCGVINMANGGHIELNSGAKLYCWGFIKGQDMDQGNNTLDVGTVTANGGATIYEDFEVGDWRGGTATSNIYNNSSRRVFPFQSYSIQNIEVPTTYKYGSTMNNYVVVNGGVGNNPASFDIIGSKNTLFLLKDSKSIVRKWYDPTTDLTCYELSGTAQLDALNIKVYISMSSSEYNLPISNSMHIILADCNMTLSKPMTMQAGSVIEIKEDATATLESNLYMFDKDDWGLYIHNYYFRSFNNLTSHKNRGAENSNAGLEDAKLIVDGTLNITGGKGYLYSTTGGANVMGNGGGKIVFGGALASSGTLYQVTVNASSPYINWVTNAINTANLCNEDGSYTKSMASSTFFNVHGRWFVSGKQNEKADHTYDFTYISSGAVSGTGGTNSTIDAVYSNDKTGLELQMKWANVDKTGQCPNWWLGMTDSYFYNWTLGSAWHQFIPTEIDNVYSGSNNQLYEKSGCDWNSIGETDENCLYTIGEVKKALVDGHFLELIANSNDPAFHLASDATKYYICFAGCNWHEATKYEGENKAYIVDGGNYIWFEGAWLNVERQEPFFYTVDETNVKTCYEYLNGDWTVAEPYVKVVDALETRKFYFLNEAITVASGKKNATVTILRDMENVTTSCVYTGKSTTCTLDLNGHVVNGTCEYLLNINGSGSTFTILDNTTEKKGEIRSCPSGNARKYGYKVNAGTLKLESGKMYATNAMVRESSSVNPSVRVTGLLVVKGATFTMTGGVFECIDEYNNYGIQIEGDASTKGVMNLSGGTVLVRATKNDSPYGIRLVYGKLNLSGSGRIECYANASSTSYGVVVEAAGSYGGEFYMTGGSVYSQATGSCRGVQVNGNVTVTGDYNATTPDNTPKSRGYGKAEISAGTITAEARTSYNSFGVLSYGNTTISGGTIISTVQKSDQYGAYGVRTLGGTTTISGSTNVTANAPTKAYALSCSATMDGTRGWMHLGVMNVNGGTFTANTTNTTTAYGLYVSGTATSLARTDSYKVFNGDYAGAGTATVNGGTFNANAKSTIATGIVVDAKKEKNEANATPVCTINGGYFKMTGTGTLNGSNTDAQAANFHINGGYYSHNGNLAGYVTTPKQVVTLPQNDANRPNYEYKVVEAYTVTFMNGENQLQSGYQEVGKTPVYDGETPTKGSTTTESYIFDGWSTTNGGDKLTSLPNVTSAGATYYAHYNTTALKYIVSLDATTNGGSCSTDKIYVNPGTAVGTLPTATKKGYTFQGWYSVSAATGGTKLEAATTISADATYYARFIVNSYALTWNLDGGTVGTAGKYGSTSWPAKNATGSPNTNVPYGSALTAPVVTRAGYTFKIWSPTVAATMPAAATTYTAQWTANTNTAYTVKHYQQNVDGTYPTTPTETESLKGTTATSVTPAVKSYDGFISPAVQTKTIAADGKMVVEYQYTRMSYTVSLNATMNGGSCATSSVTVLHGGTISSLPTAMKSGYSFVGWFTKAVGGTQITTSSVIGYNIGTIYAQFEELAASALSWDFAGGSTSSTTYTEAGDLYPGTAITYPLDNTMTRENYVFNGWSTDVTTMPEEDLTITAQWTPAVASVTSGGTTYYATLSEAITAANGKTGATVTMLQNADITSEIAISASMTLDLNGKTIKSTQAAATGVFKVDASGKTVTVTDSGTNGKISHKADYAGYLYGINLIAGSLDIQGGTIYAENTKDAASSSSYRAIGIYYSKENTQTASITMSGGKVEAKRKQTFAYGICIYTANCELTMTGGEVKASGTASIRGIYTQGTATLTNATVSATMSAGTGNCYAIFSDSNGEYTINSGTYTATSTGSSTDAYSISVTKAASASVGGAVTVNGGRFSGKNKEVNVSGGTASLKGGYYVHETDLSAKCATNYHVLPLTGEAPYNYKVVEAYTITFKNGSTTLQSGYVEKNTTPIYSGATPTKPADASYSYTHSGWTPEIATVTANATYTATFNQTENKYSVMVAAGANGSVSPASVSNIGCETVSGDITATANTGYQFTGWTLPEGVTAATEYTATSNPIRIHATAKDKIITANFAARTDINYTVKHWQQNLNDDNYTEVTADQQTLQGTTATATAAAAKSYTGFTAQTFSQGTIAGDGSTVVNIYYNRNTYTITWKDGDNNTIKTDENVKYGATPNYVGATPTKSQTVEWVYTHDSWTPAVETVTANATYTATFTQAKRKYNVTWTGVGITERTDQVAYGETPVYGEEPTQGPTVSEVFTFKWMNDETAEIGLKPVTGDVTYAGSFVGSPRPYIIRFVNDDGEELQSSEVGYGSEPSYIGTTPVSTVNPSCTFAGWTPAITIVSGEAIYTATYRCTVAPIVVEAKENEYIDVITTTTTTTVHVTGALHVSAKLETDDLILEATPNSSGEIIGTENIKATNVYFHLSREGGFKARTWYAVAVPWEVNVPVGAQNNGVFTKKDDGDFVKQVLGTTYDLIYYDGKSRAEGKKQAWRYVEDDQNEKNEHDRMRPGCAYMIYLTSDADTIRFKSSEHAALHESTELMSYSSTLGNSYANWNGIANPATYKAYLNVGATEDKGQVYNPTTKRYEWFDMKEKKLQVGQPIFVQPKTGGVVIANANAYNPSLAPRRAEKVASLTRYELYLAPSMDIATDQLIVRMSEDKEDDVYTIGQDLVKMGVSDIVPQMWIDRYDSKMCINTVAPIDNTADYPLGIFVPKNGEYDIFLDDEPDSKSTLYLTYDGEVIWNLSNGAYIANLEKGTNTHYGLRIEAKKAPEMATGFDEAVVDAKGETRKVMINEIVYIIRGEKVYTIDGQMVK